MTPSPLLVVHATDGGVALLAGTAALIVRKGGRPHAVTGDLFTGTMVVLSVSAILLALRKAQPGNLFGGLVTLYLVVTAWTAGRFRNGRAAALDWAAAALGLTAGLAIFGYGVLVAQGRLPTRGVPAGMDFFLATVVLLAVAGDASMLHRNGITGRPRIVRHLWRMCFALFEAAGSFFLGRQAFFPAAVQRSGLLVALTAVPLLLMLFWVVRLRYARVWRDRVLNPQPALSPPAI